MSPGTSCTCSSVSRWPRLSTSNTPLIDSVAPSSWRRDTGAAKNTRPISSIQTGMLAATRVTLIGEDVLSARYCRAL